MFDFLKLKNEIASIGGKVRSSRALSEKLRRQRENLATAPATKEDILRLMLEQVEEAAARYPERLLQAINATTACGKATSTDPHEGGECFEPVGVFTARRHPTVAPSVYDVQSSLCFILQPQIKEALERAIKEMPWPAGAMPVAGRAAELERLDREIAELDAEAEELRKAAEAAGIAI